jgi:hypothetical protein
MKKLTKKELKQLIKEEFEKVKTAAVRGQAMDQMKQARQSTINDKERGVIQSLQQQLTQAAQQGNIMTGKVFRLANLLSQELAKVVAAGDEAVPDEEVVSEENGND